MTCLPASVARLPPHDPLFFTLSMATPILHRILHISMLLSLHRPCLEVLAGTSRTWVQRPCGRSPYCAVLLQAAATPSLHTHSAQAVTAVTLVRWRAAVPGRRLNQVHIFSSSQISLSLA